MGQRYRTFSVVFSDETYDEVERARGKWMSRNRFIVRAVTEYLERMHQQKQLMGVEVPTTHPAATAISATTPRSVSHGSVTIDKHT